jgi:enoyl-[acyl-carrier protein] reductase I
MRGLLAGKTIVIAGIGDDQGFGWACAKCCADQGARVIAATWVPLYKTFQQAMNSGKYAEAQRLSDGSLFKFEDILPLDAAYDSPEQVPETVRTHKRYEGIEGFTISEFVRTLQAKVGQIDGLVHSLANAPEIRRPLSQTTREGYLAAISNSSYSWIALLSACAPLMPTGASAVTLTYDASQRVVPGYGGGMSSAKAALEADTRTLAYELGRSHQLRVNAISAGPLASRAARAIGAIDTMIAAAEKAAPLHGHLHGEEVGHATAFLLSPWASAITGSILYVDHGLHAMGPVCLGPAPNSAS